MKVSTFLKRQGYTFEHLDDKVYFRSRRLYLPFALFLASLMVLLMVIMIVQHLYGILGGLALLIPATMNLLKQRRVKKSVIVDGQFRQILLFNQFFGMHKIPFDEVVSINYTQQVSLKEEGMFHKHLSLLLKKGKEEEIFSFDTNKEKKEKQITELENWLKKVLSIQ